MKQDVLVHDPPDRSIVSRVAPLIEWRLVASVLCTSLVPYAALVFYLARGMDVTESTVHVPGRWFLAALFVVGVPLPFAGIALVLSRLIPRRDSFNLALLLQAYACLILLFATGYAILQASSLEPAFAGMSSLWNDGAPLSFVDHLLALHRVYGDSVYLSVITITTVGYGDLAPLSPWAKFLSASEALCGVGFLGIALGHYFSVCIHRRRHEDDAQKNPDAPS